MKESGRVEKRGSRDAQMDGGKQVKDLVSEAGGMEVEEESGSSIESDIEMVSVVDKEKGVERVLEKLEELESGSELSSESNSDVKIK